MRTNESNSQFISRLMETSKAGPLAQMIIICAIDNYLRVVEEAKPEDVGTPLFDGEAWLTACNTLREEFYGKYK